MKIFKLLFWLLAFSFFSTSLAAQKAQTAELKIQTKIYCNHCGSCEDCKPNNQKIRKAACRERMKTLGVGESRKKQL